MQTNIKKKTDVIFILFLAFCGLYIVHNIVFLRLDNYFNFLEQSLTSSVRKYYSIYDFPSQLTNIKNLQQTFGSRAPDRAIYDVFTWPFFYLFGVSIDTAVYHNFIFLIILIFFTYKIGTMIKDRYVGMLAVFCLLMYPGTFGYLRIYFTSIATVAFVSLGVYALLSSDYFKKTKKVLLWVFSCIILLKLKSEKPVVFLFVPTLIYLYQSFVLNRKDPVHIRAYYRNMLISFMVFLAFLLLLFDTSAMALRFNYYLNEVSGISHTMRVSQDKIGVNILLIYLKELFNNQLANLGFFLFAVALPFFLQSKTRHKAIIISWFLFPYVFHSVYYYVCGIRATYYTICYLPAIALMTSCGIYKILPVVRRSLRVIFLAVCVALFLMNYMYMSHLNKQFSLVWGTAYTPLMGKIALTRVSPNKGILEETQRIIDILVEAKDSAGVVFVNHYPTLHTVYSRIRLKNAIKRNKILAYDFSIKLFNIEPADSEGYVRDKLTQADLVINGNRFYPVESSPALKEYKQFGTWYDFSSYMQREERAYNAVKNNLVELKTIKTKNYDATVYLSKGARELLEKKVSHPVNFDRIKNELDLLRELQDLRYVEEGPLRLFFAQGCARIFWKDQELTGKKGLGTSFSAGGIGYSGADFSWEIEKTSPREIIATGYSPVLALKQVWKFTINEGRLSWQIALEAGKIINIYDFDVNCPLRRGYRKQVGMYGKRDAPFLAPPRNSLGNLDQEHAVFPWVFLDLGDKGVLNRSSARITKGFFRESVSLVGFGPRRLSLAPGRYEFFPGILSFFDTEDGLAEYLRKTQASQEISKGKVRLFFDGGRVKIFSREKELTAKEGVFLMILSAGRWYFSSLDALWTVKKETPQRFILEGTWKELAISSLWEFQVEEGGVVHYRLDLKAQKELNPEHVLFVVMLPDRYGSYLIPSKKEIKRFPWFHPDTEGWDTIWDANTKRISRIGVMDSRSKENVILDCNLSLDDSNSVISNTHRRTFARALIYDRIGKNNKPLSVGNYTFFAGSIEVNAKEYFNK